MSTVVDLSSLGLLGFGIEGHAAGDRAGASVSDAGDINGDGFDDFIVGAPGAGSANQGAAYVVFGHAGGFGALDFGNLQPSQGFAIQGAGNTDYTGISVSNAGDINGDGFDDLIVGTAIGGFYTVSSSHAYVIFGKEGGFGTIDVGQLSNPAGFVITGTANRADSLIVANAGDVNGDGFADIIIGDPSFGGGFGGPGAGAFYVVFGKSDGFGNIDLAHLAPGTGFVGIGPLGSRTGVSVSSAGDINGDGFDDIIVGANLGDAGGNNSGQAYVIFGKAGGFSNIDLNNPMGLSGFTIVGDTSDDSAGFSVSAAGDVNGDGFGDVIVGAPFSDDGLGTGPGAAYVIFGHAGTFSTIDLSSLGSAGFIIGGDANADAAGWSASAAGDVNGDGFDDLIVGAPSNDAGGNYAGSAYVIYGHAGPFSTIDLTGLPSASGFVVQGDLPDDRAGQSVSAAGDVNGDGVDDLVIGAPSARPNGPQSGAAYVIFGTQMGPRDVRNDFNGDGRSDILWRNDNGTLTDWLGTANGGFTPNAANALSSVSADWHVVGIGDFSGDHREDILWRNTDGRMTDWLGTATGGFTDNRANALTAVATDWFVTAVGDFNGDGRDDILFRNVDGRITDWLGTASGGFTPNSANFYNSVGTDWQVAGVGDFDGDGHDDILWRNADGHITEWLGTGLGGFIDNRSQTYEPVALQWQVAGIGDFDGDGHDDILWRNADGGVTDWRGTSNGGFLPNSAHFYDRVGNDWQVAGVGDYNGDGRDDILWRNADGRITDWLGTVGGGFTDNASNAYTPVDPHWHLQANPSGAGEWDY